MSEQPQEYIITEARLKRFENGGYFDVLLKEIRSTPSPLASNTVAQARIDAILKELNLREEKAVCGLTLTDYHEIIALLKEGVERK